MLRLQSCLSRSLHTSSVRFQFVRDVYKRINYSIQLKNKELDQVYQSEREEILEKLNTMNVKQLQLYTSKKMSQAIVSYRNENGRFECAEQLLDLDRVEQHQIEKIIIAFLSRPEQELETVRNEKKFRKSFNRDIIPKPDLEEFRNKSDPTFTGIHLTLQGVTYAHTGGGSLLGWNSWDLKEDLGFDPASQGSFKHSNLFAVCENFLNNKHFEIPSSDYMILEENLPLLPKDPYLKPKINLMRLKTTFLTMLMMENPESKFHTVKSGVFDAITELRQGNERVSVRERLELVEGGEGEGQIVTLQLDQEDRKEFLINCDPRLWREGFLEKRSLQRDYLGLALLKATAFEALCVRGLSEKSDTSHR